MPRTSAHNESDIQFLKHDRTDVPTAGARRSMADAPARKRPMYVACGVLAGIVLGALDRAPRRTLSLHRLARLASGMCLGLACIATFGNAPARTEGAIEASTVAGGSIFGYAPPVTVPDGAGPLAAYRPLALVAGSKLDIEYAALGDAGPDRLGFRYRLQGIDEAWVDAGARRQVFDANLDPGSCRFRVLDGGGARGNLVTAVLTVPPTFTQSRMFTVLCAAGITGALLVLYRMRVRQIAARHRGRYEERLRERERIARELHDTFLQGTQGLVLSIHLATKQIHEGDAVHRLLQQALDQADAVMAEGRDRIQDLRIAWDSRPDLSDSLAAVGHDLARGREVAFRAKVEGQARPLLPLARDESYRIAREALLNAFEHARARSIELQVIYGEEDLRVRVRDDGMGMGADAVARGPRPGRWGLVGMRERANGISARLDVWSKRGAGTEIELVVPAAVAYAPTSRPRRWSLLRCLAFCNRGTLRSA